MHANVGAGGGGGAGGYVTINEESSIVCRCRADADCSTGRCIGVSSPAPHDAFGCQLIEATP
jgi:hypothetical protein